MQPRVYVYKITFVDQPYWYWGWHKERKCDEYYMGSPKANKKYWEMYEPIKEIVEVFEYSDEGEFLAQCLEKNLIKPDLNKPFCLNEGYGLIFSSRAVKEKWQDPDYREKMSKIARKKWQDPDYKNRVSEALKSNAPIGHQRALSPSSRKKRLETLRKNNHQKGERNSQFGTMWVTDGTKQGSRKIKQGDSIPEGYWPGRVCK